MAPSNQSANDMGTRKSLRWRCRRGMRELDLLLLGFIDGNCALNEKELEAFQRLLDYPDSTLLEWLVGQPAALDEDLAGVIGRIRRAATG
jgi:antitoxin CptB